MEALALTALAVALLSLLGIVALYLIVIRPLQVQERERAKDIDQWHRLVARIEQIEGWCQTVNSRLANHGSPRPEPGLEELRREVDYLKSKLSMLLTPPETPPQPFQALAAASVPTASAPTSLPAPPDAVAQPPSPTAAFENQRVSDIVARYGGRLRTGHIDALTQHFSVNPKGLFLELEAQGERLVFPAQEVIYAGDFEQNYRFVFDCVRPGSGYVVVLSPARLDAQGRVIARGSLRIE